MLQSLLAFSPASYPADSPLSALACHIAFWINPLFTTPLIVALANPDDVVIAFAALAGWAAVGWLLCSVASWRISQLAGSPACWWLNRVLLAGAILMAIQGNIVTDLFHYGTFNGEAVDFRAYGWLFWTEWLGWLGAFFLTLRLLALIPRLPAWLPILPLASATLLLAPGLGVLNERTHQPVATEVEPSVFAFSTQRNLVHLLPDGLQGDVVRQVLESDSQLAAQFTGFTLYKDHVGMYPGTAPSVYTLLTGKGFDFERGFSYDWVTGDIQANSYQNDLAKAGYQVDYVPISAFICIQSAASCHPRPFNDMKARGYFRHPVRDALYSVRLIADLSLFRLLPMFLKEKIYNEGRWFLADTTMDGSSPWPDPVIREWTANLTVVTDRPVYKWYHYLGTHIPAKWDADCRQLPQASTERTAFLGQTRCVLQGIAGLLERMKSAGIYDQSAILITGDHGANLVPDDLGSPPLNSALDNILLGSGRPALLVKPAGGREPLKISLRPTHLLDLAATARMLADIDHTGTSPNFEVPDQHSGRRLFRHYSMPEFWSGNPIPYVEYVVGWPASEGREWHVSGIHPGSAPPAGFDPVNRPNAKGHVLGARLRKSLGNRDSSWITGRQLAFVFGLEGTPRDRNLVLELQFPQWMPEQGFTVSFNGGAAERITDGQTRSGSDWRAYSIALDAGLQRTGRNFVSILFDRVYVSPEDSELLSAGRIASIRVVETAMAAE